MARKLVTVTTVSHYALTPKQTTSTTTVPNGWLVPNDGATFLVIDNTGSGVVSNLTVTVAQGADVNLTTGPRPYAVPAGATDFTGFFPLKVYGSQLLIGTDSTLVGIAAYSFSATGAQDF